MRKEVEVDRFSARLHGRRTYWSFLVAVLATLLIGLSVLASSGHLTVDSIGRLNDEVVIVIRNSGCLHMIVQAPRSFRQRGVRQRKTRSLASPEFDTDSQTTQLLLGSR